jgi:hypothetical protein
VLLKDVFDYSLEEIAELVDSTVGGVKSALDCFHSGAEIAQYPDGRFRFAYRGTANVRFLRTDNAAWQAFVGGAASVTPAPAQTTPDAAQTPQTPRQTPAPTTTAKIVYQTAESPAPPVPTLHRLQHRRRGE